MFIKTHKDKLLLYFTYLITFSFLIYPYADKDWGWHFRYGEYFLTHGHLLLKDIFSWTMQEYQWVNHEWLFDPLFYLIFKYSGYFGAMISGAIVTFLSLYILSKNYTLNYWKFAAVAFFFIKITEVQTNEGLRAQILALIPLSLLIFLLSKAWKNIKFIYFIPPLILLWVNTHGTFTYGLIIESVFFAVYFFIFRKKRRTLFLIWILSFAATLFNPFGIGVYREVLKHFGTPYLQNVIEWMPITNNCPSCHVPTFYFYLILLVLAFIEQPTVQNIPFLALSLIFIIPTVSYRRNLTVFAMVSIPLLMSYLENIKLDLSKYKITQWIFLAGGIILLEYNFFTRLPGFNFYKFNEADYCQYSSDCSVKLADFLLTAPPQGRGFNFYDLGGYLIGKGINAKIFIDGRMHMWQDRDGYYPFADYINIFYNGDFKKFNEYGFNWVITPTNSILAAAIRSGGVDGKWITKYQDPSQTYFVRISL